MGLESILHGNFLRQALHLAAGSNVREPNFIGERGDKFVPARGKGASDAMLVSAETRENQESAIGQRFFPIRCETHFFQTACGANDDGLTAAQENAETFFFHRGMKTADDAATGITPAGGLVVGGEDGLAGTTGGTKKRGFWQREQVEIA
jgi:hypothetical protein